MSLVERWFAEITNKWLRRGPHPQRYRPRAESGGLSLSRYHRFGPVQRLHLCLFVNAAHN